MKKLILLWATVLGFIRGNKAKQQFLINRLQKNNFLSNWLDCKNSGPVELDEVELKAFHA